MGGRNYPLDVMVVQRLLTGTSKKYTGWKKLTPDGFYGGKTRKQIELFQKHIVCSKPQHQDGRVSVNKTTHKKLLSTLDKKYALKQQSAAFRNQKTELDIKRFLVLFKKQFPKSTNICDLKKLMKTIIADSLITDIRWVAYMLATVNRECDGKWKPIKEYGEGKIKKYGVKIKVTDPKTKEELENVYYGRGYVQITWAKNYKKMGQALGMGDDLYIHPDKTLDHNIAYKIMSLGMRKGLFTTARLAQYLSGNRTDYEGARKIINGIDHAKEIASNATKYEQLLNASLMIYGDFDPGKYENYV